VSVLALPERNPLRNNTLFDRRSTYCRETPSNLRINLVNTNLAKAMCFHGGIQLFVGKIKRKMLAHEYRNRVVARVTTMAFDKYALLIPASQRCLDELLGIILHLLIFQYDPT